MRRSGLRFRLTALYSGLFFATAALVSVSMNLMLAENLRQQLAGVPGVPALHDAQLEPALGPYPPPPALSSGLALQALSDAVLRYQWVVSGVIIALLALLSVAIGWWLTGRMLQPLHRITATARRLSVSNLHERIALAGPRDELAELADTFDTMLARLEAAVDNQQRFIANAAHELRTPLAIQRTAIQVGLADPTREGLARVRSNLLEINRRNERLIDGLLLLAQGQHGSETREPVALDQIVLQALKEIHVSDGIEINQDLEPATVPGDPVLLLRLVANLLHNAVRYNHSGGRVDVCVTAAKTLSVSNTGPEIPAHRVAELFEPFRRLHRDRTAVGEGAGLGLSIVAAIARSHDATVSARPRAGGGLELVVSWDAAPAAPERAERGKRVVGLDPLSSCRDSDGA